MEFTNDKAIFLQIADIIMDSILDRTLEADSRVPSVREYAGQLEVNVNTVVRSYEWLAQRNIIYQKRGMGFYVSEGARNKVMAIRREQFFNTQLPHLFQTMQKLGISMEEIMEAKQKSNHRA